MNFRNVAIIMAGGSGERFWPLSTPARPKQLLNLTHPTQTMLQEAVERVKPVTGDSNVFIAMGESIRIPVEEANIVAPEQILVEPLKRNTLGALVWVAASLAAQDREEAVLAILTADHKIDEAPVFQETVRTALRVARETGGLVTLGIPPTRPETGYGYIEFTPDAQDSEGRKFYRSAGFREKPDLATAEEFVRAGTFLWNSGMFFWTLGAFDRELSQAHPEAHAILLDITAALREKSVERAEQLFSTLPNLSIDYALMEKAKDVFVIHADFPWDDVGAWDALERSLGTDHEGNVFQGSVVQIDSSGNIALNDRDNSTIALLNVQDLVVVSTEHATLVCPKADAQRVKELIKLLPKP